jgi:YVTN family beta-propeller protein
MGVPTAALAGAGPAAANTTYRVTATIGVGALPIGVGVDPATNTIYAANFLDNTVSVINEATNTVTASIGVSESPNAVDVDAITNTIYVLNSRDSSPRTLAVDPTTHAVYVANAQSNDVSVVTPQVPDTDLTIAPPANVTIDATGPSRATATYPAPTVTDGDDPTPPAATCSPASGSMFPIGTTTVTCEATDPDDTPATATASFTVTVNGAGPQLALLGEGVQGVGSGTILANKVAKAQSYLTQGNTAEACVKMRGFIQEVKAQSGKSIRVREAGRLIAEAKQIRPVLGC